MAISAKVTIGLEYFGPVRWLDTLDSEGAVQVVGMFGNKNTDCKPSTPKGLTTVDRLKTIVPGYDDEPAETDQIEN